MLNLVDRREGQERQWPNEFPSEGLRPGEPPVEVVTHRGKVHLRPRQVSSGTLKEVGPVWSAGERLRTVLIALLLLAGVAVATRAFMAVFTATIEATSRALPMGSLTAPRRDAVHALGRELARRREALAGYDRHIANAADHPPLQAAWHDLKQRDRETVEHLERHLDVIRRLDSPPLTAGLDRN